MLELDIAWHSHVKTEQCKKPRPFPIRQPNRRPSNIGRRRHSEQKWGWGLSSLRGDALILWSEALKVVSRCFKPMSSINLLVHWLGPIQWCFSVTFQSVLIWCPVARDEGRCLHSRGSNGLWLTCRSSNNAQHCTTQPRAHGDCKVWKYLPQSHKVSHEVHGFMTPLVWADASF